MHWITKPGTSVAGRAADRDAGQPRAAGHSGGAQLRLPHRAGPAWPMRSTASISARTGSASIPTADYDETVAAIEEVVNGYPGLFHNVETYLNERIDEVLSGSSETFVVRIYGPDLKGIHDKADEVEQALKDIPGIVDLHVQLQSEVPADAGRSRSRDGPALWPQTRRRAPGVGDHDGRRRSRRPFQGRQGLRRERVEHARNAPQPHQRPRICRSTRPAAGTCAWAMSPTCASRRLRASSIVKTPRAASTSAPTSRDRDLGAVMADVNSRLAEDRVPTGISRRGARRVCRAAGCPEPPDAVRDRRGDRRVPHPAGVLRERAPGGPRLLDLALGAGGRPAGGVLHRRRHLAWFARRLSHGLRDRGAQQDHADQPLSASGAARRRNLWSGACAARGSRTAFADLDDGAWPPGWRSCRW